MLVERALGILKGRWRILLKRIDVPLKKYCGFGDCLYLLVQFVHR
jgi:hypothetical protein